jgi:hypothetical protein
MDFLKVVVVFGVFFVGGVLAFQAFVGKELPIERWMQGPPDPDNPGVEHPPERHRLRLFLIGLGAMVAAVVLGLLIL